jgi:hypothetical protein
LQQATNPPKTIIKNKTPTHELNEIRDNDETTTCDRSQLHLTEVGGRNSSRIPPFLGGSSPGYGLLSQHITKRDADPHTPKKLQNHHHLKTKSHKLNFLFTTSTPNSSKTKQTERKMLLKLDTKSPILNTTISTFSFSFFFFFFLLISSYNKR